MLEQSPMNKKVPLKSERNLIKTFITEYRNLEKKVSNIEINLYPHYFEKGIDAYKSEAGLTGNYIKKTLKSTVALQSKLNIFNTKFSHSYIVTTRIMGFDGRKILLYQELLLKNELLATLQTLSISFDIKMRKSCQFEPEINERLKKIYDNHFNLPLPEDFSPLFELTAS